MKRMEICRLHFYKQAAEVQSTSRLVLAIDLSLQLQIKGSAVIFSSAFLLKVFLFQMALPL